MSIARGRLSKANQADAHVTLCVHAGIAASDAICCSSLGRHAQGESHDDATTLLASADKDAAKHLGTLLRLKTKAGYGHTPATKDEVKKAARAADALIEKARRVRMLLSDR
jgi:hypothetical protein